MRIIIVRPEKGNIVRKDSDGNLYDLQALVGGYIEPCAPMELKEQGIEMLANEEGLLKRLPYNCNLDPFFYVGTMVFVGVDGENFVSLTPEQQDFIETWLENLNNF